MFAQYTEAILWYAAWPILIYIAYRFVMLNLNHIRNMERLEELEACCRDKERQKSASGEESSNPI